MKKIHARRKKALRTNLLDSPIYRIFNGKQYRLHTEHPKTVTRTEIAEERKELRDRGFVTRVIKTAYGFGIYKQEK